jgi:hypoxanthine-DNA glycosylase
MQNNLALWDVLEICERKGSLDVHIKNPVPNQILKIVESHPSISKIFFHGRESHKLFLKYFDMLKNIDYQVVPLTSPANTVKFELKLESWRKALL